jgi:hypothetical protein
MAALMQEYTYQPMMVLLTLGQEAVFNHLLPLLVVAMAQLVV